MKDIFPNINQKTDRLFLAKLFFNLMYVDGYFIEALKNLTQRIGFVVNDIGCHFPDKNSFYEEEHFEGIEFFLLALWQFSRKW